MVISPIAFKRSTSRLLCTMSPKPVSYTHLGKTVSSNVDFYSGFVYEMIGLPQEIFTPLFARARIVGWCAHRNEELNLDVYKRQVIRLR